LYVLNLADFNQTSERFSLVVRRWSRST